MANFRDGERFITRQCHWFVCSAGKKAIPFIAVLFGSKPDYIHYSITIFLNFLLSDNKSLAAFCWLFVAMDLLHRLSMGSSPFEQEVTDETKQSSE
jgi:hypothetical protein